MQAYRLHVIVPESRKVLIEFPDSIPPGEVELIVIVPDEEPAEKVSQDAQSSARPTLKELLLAETPRAEIPELLRDVHRGLADVEAGRVVSHDEARARIMAFYPA